MTPADLRSPTFTPHGRSSATSTVASDSRHTRNRASSSSSWAGRVPAHVYSPALLELEPHHSGVGGIVLGGQRGRVAPRSDVVRPLGHLGPMAAEPFGVPLQRGAAPEVSAVEATRHQLAAYPGTGMAGIPFPVILAIPRTRLSPNTVYLRADYWVAVDCRCVAVVVVVELVAGHLAFDDSRICAAAARGEQLVKDLGGDALVRGTEDVRGKNRGGSRCFVERPAGIG